MNDVKNPDFTDIPAVLDFSPGLLVTSCPPQQKVAALLSTLTPRRDGSSGVDSFLVSDTSRLPASSATSSVKLDNSKKASLSGAGADSPLWLEEPPARFFSFWKNFLPFFLRWNEHKHTPVDCAISLVVVASARES